MLILKPDAVTYCFVRVLGADTGPQPGLRYRDRYFLRGRSYPRGERRFALREIRALLEGRDRLLIPILVDSGDRLTLWFHSDCIAAADESVPPPSAAADEPETDDDPTT